MNTKELLVLALAAAQVAGAADFCDYNRNGKKDAFEDAAQPVEKRVEDLLSQLTLDEKIGQLNQLVAPAGDDKEFFALMRKGAVSSYIWTRTDPAYRNRFQRTAVEESRMGVPLIFGMDIIHGAYLTFPISLGLACSFEPELFERAQTVAAREARAEGIDWTFAPMCDLARDPRWGRVAETCGEDPYLSALCNAAQVRGFQGADPSAPGRVAACLKHYVGYSAVTGGRDYNDSEITEWELRNLHLVSFGAAVKAGALTVMSSFNTLEGIPAVANRHTLTDILRGDLGFKGFVVSDWESVMEMIRWGYAADKADAARLALNAGNDMDMKAMAYQPNLAAEVKAGRVTMATLDEAVRRVLRVKFQLGLFERPYVDETAFAAVEKAIDAELPLAREAVSKSVVLLKNDGVVPFRPGLKKVALIGPFAEDKTELIGCWNGRQTAARVSIAEALREALPQETALEVVKGCSVMTTPPTITQQDGRIVLDRAAVATDPGLELSKAVAAAKGADIVVMAIGETRSWTGENASRASLGLTGRQQDLFDAVAAAGKPVVAVVFSGRPLVLPRVWDKAAAVFYAWQPGMEAAHGICDLLAGKASPSARLSMSVPCDVSQVPAYYNGPTTGRPGQGQYRDTPERGSRYCFGYGLTYTTFAYGGVRMEGNEAVAEITNTGTREGTETAQLYIRQNVCHEGVRPARELRGFKRVTLKPGEKATVRFALNGDTLGYFDRQGKHRADAGQYTIWIAPDSRSGAPTAFAFGG